MRKIYFVYIMTNPGNTVLYTGVTNNLLKRTFQHKEKTADGFTKKYNAVKLLYYEIFNDVTKAIARETQIKSYRREKKIDLVNALNPKWEDLYFKL